VARDRFRKRTEDMRPEDRQRVQVEVVSRVVERYVKEAAGAGEGYLETLVSDTLYHERRRLEKDPGRKARADSAFYDGIQRRLRHASEQDLRELLELAARRFVGEVVGNFDQRVYRFSTRVAPAGLWALLNAMSPSRVFSLGEPQRGLSNHVRLDGEVEHVKHLLHRGTLIVVPTHSSNLDSIIMGYAVYLMGLPPLTYGAGLNLFTNPLISFFMRNLGAYRVDRKKTSTVYKDVLKEYATCSLEMGYHNLFFPGGTRSRSGAVERKLKLGLLGTAVRAYIGNLRARKPRPNIYLVPCTLTYKLVLEAETLIEDHLKETGKSRYIIEDDEFSRPRRVLNFLSNLISLESDIVLHFSSPVDVFGNRVDLEGSSVDANGRPVDASRYVMREGQPVHDPQRDAEYTREAGEEVVRAFLRDNVIMSTHLLGHSLFNLLRHENPTLDLYRLLRTGGAVASFPMPQVHAEVDRVLESLRGRADGPRLGRVVEEGDVPEIVNNGLRHFGIYHTRPAAQRRGDRIFHEDRNLLLYYGNRLRGYDRGPARDKPVAT
jgi:glycerol-3-phosphate O-acyltransferase